MHLVAPWLAPLRRAVAAGAGLWLCYRLGARYNQPGRPATPARYRQHQQLLAARREAVNLTADWQILYDHLADPAAHTLARLADAQRIAARWRACSPYVEAACRALGDAAGAVTAHPDLETARAAAGPYLSSAALYLEALAALP